MIWTSVALAGFGGAELAVVAERDGSGGETLLDVGVVPWTTDRGRVELSLAPAQLSWGVLGVSEGRLDRLELSALSGHAGVGDARAWFDAGSVVLDQDLGVRELGLVGGGMGGSLLQERLSWGLGADLHARLGEETRDLYLGLPLSVAWHQPLPWGVFAAGAVALRPSFGVVGLTEGAADGRFTAELGYHAIDEEDASLDLVAGYGGGFDSLVEGNEHRVGIGARASF